MGSPICHFRIICKIKWINQQKLLYLWTKYEWTNFRLITNLSFPINLYSKAQFILVCSGLSWHIHGPTLKPKSRYLLGIFWGAGSLSRLSTCVWLLLRMIFALLYSLPNRVVQYTYISRRLLFLTFCLVAKISFPVGIWDLLPCAAHEKDGHYLFGAFGQYKTIYIRDNLCYKFLVKHSLSKLQKNWRL